MRRRFGSAATATDDAEGEVTEKTRELEGATDDPGRKRSGKAARERDQVPASVSAIKINGVRSAKVAVWSGTLFSLRGR